MKLFSAHSPLSSGAFVWIYSELLPRRKCFWCCQWRRWLKGGPCVAPGLDVSCRGGFVTLSPSAAVPRGRWENRRSAVQTIGGSLVRRDDIIVLVKWGGGLMTLWQDVSVRRRWHRLRQRSESLRLGALVLLCLSPETSLRQQKHSPCAAEPQ